jgi:hypothetical protein
MEFIINERYLLKDKVTKLPNLNHFIEVKKPYYNENESSEEKEYHSLENYYIDKDGYVNIYSDFDENSLVSFIIGDGIFIGVDKGEWNGELIYKDYSSMFYSEEYKIIEHDNILSIFQFNNELFVLTGLSHLMTKRGKIHKLEYKNEKWNISKSFDLESEPQVYKIINEKQILIVTHIGIIIFDGNNIIKYIKNSKWDALFANSIYFMDEYIYIGARSFLFTVNQINYETKVYKYKNNV